ncbi:hypothetical protein COCON_G00027130 [Conger conger]|uniref:Small integral membrane protein 5 n=1 Tax=Conger conger TaxID=82655 RepID=A0A9Q1DY13_CONCO|nr:hypothetical protein COCON_G00027130 [Conger conger]
MCSSLQKTLAQIPTAAHVLPNMDAKEEVLDLLHKVWTKLQGLPDANPMDLGAFLVLMLFIVTFLLLIVMSCIHCCCCGKQKYQASRVEPLHPL